MNDNPTNPPNPRDRITASTFSGSGATLNVTDTGTPLLSGTVFQLFSAANGAFSTVNLPTASPVNPAVTYTWQNNLATSGGITLLTGLNPNPTNITSTVTSTNTPVLAWPSTHIGWTLQAQTNSLTVGIANNWANVAGSASTNQVVVPIVADNPTVFYRMVLGLP
jgi:hypothetical protein